MTFEKSKVSSAKILHMEVILSGKLFIYIYIYIYICMKNKSGPNPKPCGTP